jgi:hypothetical protein
MPRIKSQLAAVAVIIAVGFGTRVHAQELSCPPGYGPNSSYTGCVASQPNPGSAQSGAAGEAQQILNGFGAAVQGASSNAAGAVEGMLNSFGMQGQATPSNQGYGGNAQGGYGSPPPMQGGYGAPPQNQGEYGTPPQTQGGYATPPSNAYAGEQPSKISAHDPCTLLPASDVSTALGMPVKNDDAASEGVTNECLYDATTTGFEGETPRVTLFLIGGRADYDRDVSTAQQYGMPYAALSGLGDKAYINNSCGEQCAAVGVLKGRNYFQVQVQEDVNHSRNATALARKVAERIR